MEIIREFRKKIQYYFLRVRMNRNERGKMVMGLDEARSIGIVFDASTAADYRLITNHVKLLKDLGKKVTCIGFVQQKKLPGYLHHHVNWTFCQKKDFAWNLRLKTTPMKEFVTDEFDILIDLSSSELFFTKYLAGISKAKYKVGKFNPDQIDIFDLLMQVPDNSNLQELMDQIIHYLKIIKKPVINA